MRVNKLLLACLTVAAASPCYTAPATAARAFTIVISRVAQTDNLDKPDTFGSDKADFYHVLWINGKDMGKSENASTDDGVTTWRRNISTTSRFVKIRLRLMDDDGGLAGKDDHVDVNRRGGKKDIDFTYDTRTGRIRGDVMGKKGTVYHAAGEGDSDRGQLWFKIE